MGNRAPRICNFVFAKGCRKIKGKMPLKLLKIQPLPEFYVKFRQKFINRAKNSQNFYHFRPKIQKNSAKISPHSKKFLKNFNFLKKFHKTHPKFHKKFSHFYTFSKKNLQKIQKFFLSFTRGWGGGLVLLAYPNFSRSAEVDFIMLPFALP